MEMPNRAEISGKSRDALTESLEMDRILFQTSPLGIFVQNAEGTFLSANPAAERFLGLSLEQLNGQASIDPRWASIHEDGSHFRRDAFPSMEALCTGKPVEKVVLGIFNPKLEQTTWIEASAVPVFRSGDPVPFQVFTTLVDITERKEGEVSLRASERKFSALFESMTEGVVVHELVRDECGEILDYRILAANPAFRMHTGIEPASAIGRLGSELFGIPGAPYLDVYSKVALTGEPCVFETFFPPLEKNFRISVISPKIGQFATLFVDITDYKKKEELLQNTLNRLELATTSADMGVWDWNLLSGSLTWNDRMFELYGCTSEEFHGTVQDWKDGLHHEDLNRAVAECEAALRGEAPFDTEFRVQRRDGAILWIKANGLVLRDENGKPVRMIGLNHDISEQKNAQEKIYRLAEDLERRVEERTQQLVMSESQFRLLFENAPLGMSIMDSTSGRFLSVNSRLAEICGYSLEELRNLNFQDITHPDHLAEDLGSVQALVSGTILEVQKEKRYLHRSGKVVWVRLRMVRMPSILGESPRHISLVEDITEAHQAQELLQNSENRFRTLIADLQVGVLIQSANSEILLSNPKALELLGLSEEQLIGKSSFSPEWNVIHEDGTPYPGPTHPVPQAIATRQPVRNAVMGVYRPTSKDRVWLLVNADPQFYPDQSLHQVICTFVDITARKEALAQLREIEAQNQAIISATPDLIFMNRLDGEFLGVHASDPSLLQVLPEDVLHRKIDEVLPKPVAEKFSQAFAGALDSKALQKLEYSLPVGGQEKHFEARVISRDVETVVSIVRDVTAIKLAEEERKRSIARMDRVQALEALGVLVAGIAHNINNVLAIIMGTASLREEHEPAPSDLEAYQVIGRACKQGRSVLKTLLQFAKPTLLTQAPIDLHRLIGEVCVFLGNTTRNRVKILEVFAGEPLWINGDLGSINHVLMNLAVNSLDAMPNGGNLTFQTSIPEAGWVELSVEDNGTGMTPEVLAHVLEPFYTTKEVGKGTGLGLSMTYGVVKAHGGTIDITSQPGLGTAVKLRFPRIRASTQVETIHDPVSSVEPMNVLLVDDDEDVRILMGRMLKKAGILQVNPVSGGEEALESLRSGVIPDLIILDQNMPGMNGVQTMAIIRSIYPDMPILVSSGQPDIEDWDCFKQPKVGVISKPFTMEEIRVKLAQFASEHVQGQ